MAGLTGFVDLAIEPGRREAVLAQMLTSLQAEPWHQVSGRTVDAAALGRVSLGVLHPGPQPVSNEATSVWIVLDGDIHSLCALARSGLDSPMPGESQPAWLLRLYETHGERFVGVIAGTYNLVIWDTRTQTLLIANDHYGSRPFYYTRPAQGGLSFASEIKALLHVPGVERRVNVEAAIEFFTFRHLLGDKTPFVDIHWLPPASLLTYQAGRIRLDTYWQPPLEAHDDRLSARDHAVELNGLLRLAVEHTLGQNHPGGILLSGGMDSRLLVSAADGRWPVHTFTHSTPGSWDSRLAQQVAERAGTIHHFVEIPPDFLVAAARRGTWLTDGLMTCVDFYALTAAQHLKPHVGLVCFGLAAGSLAGLGVDPAFAGISDEQVTQHIFATRANLIKPALQPAVFSQRFYDEVKDVPLANLRRVVSELPDLRSDLKVEYYFLRQYAVRSALHGPVLVRSQVETGVPCGDGAVLDRTCRVPGALRQHRLMQIEMLKQASPALAAIPWQFSGLPVAASTPRRVRLQRALYRAQRELSQRTRNLIPAPRGREQADWPTWFRTCLRPWLEEMLLSEQTLARGYFNPSGLRQIIDAHQRGTHDYSRQFGPLLTFELWHRLFLDDEAP